MALVHRAGLCAGILCLGALLSGCRSAATRAAVGNPSASTARPAPPQTASQSAPQAAGGAAAQPIQQIVHRPPDAVPHVAAAIAHEPGSDSDGLFEGRQELDLVPLTDLVLSRNASLQAMAFSWRAAAQRYPQAIALDDPTFMAMAAPASFASNQVQPAYVLGGAQKLPWFGKRAARGAAAQASASAEFHDLRDARLAIEQSTRMAFFEYYLVARELELNRQNVQLTRQFRATAQSKYENNQVTEQDVLQADVELASTERRLLELDRMYRVSVARINTLLRRNPAAPLPPPPASLAPPASVPAAAALQQLAATQRPDLAALAARVRAEQAAVALAYKQYYPDAEFYGRYDSFWQPASTQSDLRPQVGMNMNVPLYRGKLQAAVCEAQFRLSQRQAEYRQKVADAQFEVEAAHAQVVESRQAIDLYRDKLLPAAQAAVETARVNYDVGKTTFLNLLTSQQQLLIEREQYQVSLAAFHSRLADLQRAVGGELPQFAELPPEELLPPAEIEVAPRSPN